MKAVACPPGAPLDGTPRAEHKHGRVLTFLRRDSSCCWGHSGEPSGVPLSLPRARFVTVFIGNTNLASTPLLLQAE